MQVLAASQTNRSATARLDNVAGAEREPNELEPNHVSYLDWGTSAAEHFGQSLFTSSRVDPAAHGAIPPRCGCRTGPSFGSRLAMRQPPLCGSAESQRYRDQHVKQRQPVGQRARESFMKTSKYEEVLRNEYRDLADARASIRDSSKRSTTRSGCIPP